MASLPNSDEEVKAQKVYRFYRRLSPGRARLSEAAASRWEFEVEKQDGQRLRKLYLGHVERDYQVLMNCMLATRKLYLGHVEP